MELKKQLLRHDEAARAWSQLLMTPKRAVVVIDGSGMVKRINLGVTLILGYAMSDLHNRHATSIFKNIPDIQHIKTATDPLWEGEVSGLTKEKDCIEFWGTIVQVSSRMNFPDTRIGIFSPLILPLPHRIPTEQASMHLKCKNLGLPASACHKQYESISSLFEAKANKK